MTPQAGPRYPWAPLEAQARALLLDAPIDDDKVLDPLNDVRLAALLDVDRTQVRRWRTYGVSAVQADTLANRIGVDPYQLWPEILDAAIAEVERTCAADGCDETFVPPAKVPGKKFCSRRCKGRENRRIRYQTDPEFRAQVLADVARHYAETSDYQKRRRRIERARARERRDRQTAVTYPARKIAS
jgi:hypothetical protein